MRMKFQTTVKTLVLLTVCLMSFSTIVNAQKTPIKFEVDKSPEIIEAMKQPSFKKGLTSYNAMNAIFQKNNTKQVKFNVKIEVKQQVIVEVFNEEGELIEVVYNDLMSPQKGNAFTINGQKWQKNISYFIRVTTDDFIENHEVVFK